MKRKTADWIGFLVSWFALVFQLILMLKNSEQNLLETLVRFFSYFTILTNALVALYFSTQIATSRFKNSFVGKKGGLTAITVYILVVGLVYQVILRYTWEPTGLQLLIDELLHSVIPAYFLIYWIYFANKADIEFKVIKYWFFYPLFYFCFILLRGHFSSFYPYPFIDVDAIGYQQTFKNFIFLSLFACVLYIILYFIGNKLFKNR